ncbi:hypothetical protein GCM10022393_41380 [Aquimarina addita]|uniref:Knr4/Smi1-like domain-containing protein n=1 Tax=Aquimarina addita TaxID=870485 RepID=A0ABP6UTY7_9FLAO
MNFLIKAEEILGRNLKPEEGITISLIKEKEKQLEIKIPQVLIEFYATIGNNLLFIDGFQHFAKIDDLFVTDGKLVFLQENQSVVYWAVDLEDSQTIFQTTDQNFNAKAEWFKEKFSLRDFLEHLLYFQCIMADESYHRKANSGFTHFASLEIDEYHKNVISQKFISSLDQHSKIITKHNGLVIFWKPDAITMYFTNNKGEICDLIMTCVKSESLLDILIDTYGFNEL